MTYIHKLNVYTIDILTIIEYPWQNTCEKKNTSTGLSYKTTNNTEVHNYYICNVNEDRLMNAYIMANYELLNVQPLVTRNRLFKQHFFQN